MLHSSGERPLPTATYCSQADGRWSLLWSSVHALSDLFFAPASCSSFRASFLVTSAQKIMTLESVITTARFTLVLGTGNKLSVSPVAPLIRDPWICGQRRPCMYGAR
jgi:hypothetical protein